MDHLSPDTPTLRVAAGGSTLRHMTDLLHVTTILQDLHAAKKLARTLVSENFVGSARIVGPTLSISWEGEIEEYMLILATTTAAYRALGPALMRHHPQQNPEVTVLTLDGAAENYAAWLREVTGPGN